MMSVNLQSLVKDNTKFLKLILCCVSPFLSVVIETTQNQLSTHTAVETFDKLIKKASVYSFTSFTTISRFCISENYFSFKNVSFLVNKNKFKLF